MSLISGACHPSAGKDSALATFRFTASLQIQPKQSEFHGNKHKVGSVLGKLLNVTKVFFFSRATKFDYLFIDTISL